MRNCCPSFAIARSGRHRQRAKFTAVGGLGSFREFQFLNKIDILPFIDFDKDCFYKGIKALNEKAPVFEVSCRTGDGVEEVIKWLEEVKRK